MKELGAVHQHLLGTRVQPSKEHGLIIVGEHPGAGYFILARTPLYWIVETFNMTANSALVAKIP